MNQICPFCYSEMPFPAVICPHCTRDIRFPEAVLGPPITTEDQARHLRTRASALGFTTGLRLLFIVPFAILAGFPVLLVLVIGGAVLGLTMLISRVARESWNGDRHHEV